MTKVYVSNSDGSVSKVGDSNYFTDNSGADTFDKSVTQLSGNGNWKTLHGIKLFTDKEGVVIKGQDEFIGRKWDDLKNLDYNDVFTVMRGLSRANDRMSKCLLFPYFKAEAQQIKKETMEYLDKALARSNKTIESRKDPRDKQK